ncbi:Succinate dehydrogenase cytochrome B subunit, mitochondrial [Beauveria bassiana]|uniref:Succinate dehydrogenase cytochrome B subunit, mitochondrial n=1 Tax=Beauveria bassiana TaxID=176275 RepID=A0A2N6P382_BEABA|nr:Succinate dehydrogenase cytochrome B subunit, mitochondrial [Beauveria bassiana]
MTQGKFVGLPMQQRSCRASPIESIFAFGIKMFTASLAEMQHLGISNWQRCMLHCRGQGVAVLRSSGFRVGLRRASIPLQVPVAHLSRTLISTNSEPRASPRITKIPTGHQDAALRNQRLKRPIAPHLEIYKLDQTYLGTSAWMRITGCTLSGVAWLYFLGYLVAPVFGGNWDSAALVSGFHALPTWTQTGFKMLMVFPFAFHSINGVKQLAYDAGFLYSRVTIIRADRFLWISSFLTSLAIVNWL